MWTMRLDIHRPRPELAAYDSMTMSRSENNNQPSRKIEYLDRPPTPSSLQSIPVELLSELSEEHSSLVLMFDTHSGIRHIHSKEPDGVHPNLFTGTVSH